MPGRFLDSSAGGKIPGRSILAVGVEAGLKDAGFNEAAFLGRGGVFDWTREPEPDDLEW